MSDVKLTRLERDILYLLRQQPAGVLDLLTLLRVSDPQISAPAVSAAILDLLRARVIFLFFRQGEERTYAVSRPDDQLSEGDKRLGAVSA